MTPVGLPSRQALRQVASLVTVALLVGCHPVADPPSAQSTPGTSGAGSRMSTAEAREALRGLARTPRSPSGPAYERDAFGEAWADIDGNRCNQRDDVLLRDAVPGSVRVQSQGACDHDVLAGTWIDPYTGTTLTFDDLKDLSQAQAIQIDHVVPLAEAWVSGASTWSARRRERFANDLRVLVASDGPTNAGKGSSDPAAWRPRKGHQCDYARRWILVKQRWELSVDDSEAAALSEMLDLCDR